MIEVQNLVKSGPNGPVLQGLSFTLPTGGIYGIIGPNGAGKSTLLGILSGVIPYDGGEVKLAGKAVGAYSRKALARRLAVLQQEGLPAAGFTVKEVVGMARFPFQNWLGDEPAAADGEKGIDKALAVMGLTSLASRRLDQLSGGERQRVALAKVMAQQPEIVLLDEPTTFLDIGYQVQLLDAVKAWQRREQLTVVAVLHDLNLAAQYCDRLIVIDEGCIVCTGTPQEVVTSRMIRAVYAAEAVVLPHPATGCPQLLLQSGSSLQGGERT
ncbi:ABC transporter ATP-binding protein [Paenibacillaceae bacterium]|nr:ABC transporter ATP-binding protein [Paenibacillaceae bacterium]